jgi:hypothetical protein
MKRLLLALALLASPLHAADRKPLVIVSGETKQMPAGDTVPVASGGTGATAASGARTNLGLVIGTNVQAYDADLTTYAGITPSANVQSLLSAADYAAVRTALSLGTFATQSVPTGSTQCLHADSSGVVTGTGSDCGSGGGGGGTVTTTGSPASGNLAKFSGSTSIVNGDLSGDCTTSGTLAITCTKTSGVAFAASATTDTTSASNIGSGTLPAARIAANALALGKLAQSGANTMLGNWSGSTADVAANAMPSCADTGGNHLNYVAGTGVTCGTSSAASSSAYRAYGDGTIFGWTAGVTAETTMNSYTLPAGTLATNGQYIKIRANGTATSTHSKTIKLYFGATVVATLGPSTGITYWGFDVVVLRLSATTQFAPLSYNFSSTSSVGVGANPTASPAETLSGTVLIKVTGTVAAGAVANELTTNFMSVEVYP